MNVSYQGFSEAIATFEADDSVKAGSLVKISANGKVAPAADKEAFVGVCRNVRGGYAGVQLKGYCTVPYTGAVALGWQTLVSTADGEVKPAEASTGGSGAATAAAGTSVLVTDMDTSSSTLGMIL